MEITQDELRRYVSYDPETGVFTRLATANGKNRGIGKPSGSINKVLGYVELCVGRGKILGHRAAWIYMNGPIPPGARIDHRNLDRCDNRIENLRMATHAENLRNCNVRVDNTSGVKGVWYDRSRDKWAAGVGKQKLGRFDTLLDAACARKSAALRNYGEFARE